VNGIKGFFYPVLEFRFQQVPAIPLRVSEGLGQKIRASAGPFWPVRDSESLKLGSESGAPRAKACACTPKCSLSADRRYGTQAWLSA
jgi:hypothetical protein